MASWDYRPKRTAAVVLSDDPAPTGGRLVLYLLPDNRRVPVVFRSPEYSSEAVMAVGAALSGGEVRAPRGSLTETKRRADRGTS